MNSLMLDLETWGTSAGCAIRSIGAVFFESRAGRTFLGSEFYTNVDTQSCLDAGLRQDDSTVQWWAKQSAEAQQALNSGQQPLKLALHNFKTWAVRNATEDIEVWAQGSAFDIPVIEAAAAAVGVAMPWKFWNVFDTRTVYRMRRFDPRQVSRQGTYHNALDDAKHQVRTLAACFGAPVATEDDLFV